MTLPTVTDAAYPTPSEVRDAILRTILLGGRRRGLTINILPQSDAWIRADAVAKRVSVAIANGRLALQDVSPLEATGDALVRLAKMFGVTKRPASSSTGYVRITTSAAVTIPAGYQGTGPGGYKYQTTGISLVVSTGAQVQIRAVATGKATNLAAGAVLSWDSAAVGQLKPTAIVAAGGIDGGANEDDEEVLRRRLIDRIAFPAGGGNTAQIRAWAEDSSAAVDRAFVYAAVRGPGSYDVAVVGASGDGVLSAATCAQVAAYIEGKMPGHASLNVTSVAAQLVDVALAATLPLPVSAGGAGGGWRQGAPWPAELCKVTAYASGVVTVGTTATPTAGDQIGVWDPTYTNSDGDVVGKMREYTIAASPAVGGGAGAWTFAVQGGFAATMAVGAFISAGAVNLISYADSFAAEVRKLGPGEKTASVFILPRGRRTPGVDLESPAALTSRLLDASVGEAAEVEDVGYLVRYQTGTTTPKTGPTVPAVTTDPPGRLSLKHFSIVKAA